MPGTAWASQEEALSKGAHRERLRPEHHGQRKMRQPQQRQHHRYHLFILGLELCFEHIGISITHFAKIIETKKPPVTAGG